LFSESQRCEFVSLPLPSFFILANGCASREQRFRIVVAQLPNTFFFSSPATFFPVCSSLWRSHNRGDRRKGLLLLVFFSPQESWPQLLEDKMYAFPLLNPLPLQLVQAKPFVSEPEFIFFLCFFLKEPSFFFFLARYQQSIFPSAGRLREMIAATLPLFFFRLFPSFLEEQNLRGEETNSFFLSFFGFLFF